MQKTENYKQSEVGLIPEEWEVKELGDLLKFGSGKDYKELRTGEVPVFGTGGVMTYVNDFLYDGDSVGIGRKGTIDKPVFLSGKFWTVDTLFFTYDFKDILPKFAFYKFLLVKWKEYNEASGVPSLNKNTLEKIKISVPPLPEQTAIASALSDMDALIAQTEKLIEKKKAIKQGVMQELLTGKKRLKGFENRKGYKQTEVGLIPEDWEVRKIDELGELDNDNLNSSTDPDFEFNYISLEDVKQGNLRSYSELKFQNAPSRARRKLQKDDLLISTVRPNLKSHFHFKISSSNDWVCSTGFSVLRCNRLVCSSAFVFNHFFAEGINIQIDNLITGSNYPAISSREVKNLLIPISPLPEQIAIASAISDIDNDIKIRETKLQKLKLQKQGMMQALLTGKIRLV